MEQPCPMSLDLLGWSTYNTIMFSKSFSLIIKENRTWGGEGNKNIESMENKMDDTWIMKATNYVYAFTDLGFIAYFLLFSRVEVSRNILQYHTTNCLAQMLFMKWQIITL